MTEYEKNKLIPRYQQIAVDIASRIVSEEYREGAKIYARSALASQYGVSPETARRAICVLTDLDIAESEKGSGVTIKSRNNAVQFVKQYGKRQTIESLKEKVLESIFRQRIEMEVLNSSLSELVSASEHFRSLNPFAPFEMQITRTCIYLNYTVADLQFWQHTGATVIALKRENSTMVSPGPYVTLQENDVLYFVTQDDSPSRVREFLYPTAEENNGSIKRISK